MCMSYKNLTSDLRTTTWTEQCLCSASPEPLAGQSKVPYLYDPFNFEVFEGKWPIKVKIFENSFFWKSLLGHWSTCLGLICWKSVVGKLIVGPGVLHKNNSALPESEPPILPRVQKLLNVVTHWPVHVSQILSGLVWVCQSYSRKIDFSDPISHYNRMKARMAFSLQ